MSRKVREYWEGNKLSLIILCVACVAIVGLSIPVIINVVKNNQADTSEEERIAIDESDEYYEYDVEVTQEQMDKWAREYDEHIALFDELSEKARELLSKEPADVAGVNSLYEEAIADYIAREDFDYAWELVQSEKNILRDAGLKNEALEAMTRIDYSSFSDVRQYECYNEIMKYAEEIGNQERTTEYANLAAEKKEAWDIFQASTGEFRKKVEERIRANKEREAQGEMEEE